MPASSAQTSRPILFLQEERRKAHEYLVAKGVPRQVLSRAVAGPS